LAAAVLFSSTAAGVASPLAATHLRAEYLEHPLGLDAAHPRLSWIVTGDGRARRQTAYRIVVAASADDARAGRGTLWDTGKVASAASNAIRYAGIPLASGQRAWWAVQLWDESDRPSAWSAPTFWEMGLLDPSDWHGEWIARAPFAGTAPRVSTLPPLLRRSFRVDGPLVRARVYIAGLGYHELSINGRRIGDHLLDPAYTRYDRRVLYVTHDVTAALHPGENVLGVILGNGWFNVETLAAWQFDHAPWRASPRLKLELRLDYADGRTATICSDPLWKTSDSAITFSSIYSGESHDARREQPGWDQPGFDDRAWTPALPVDAPKGRLVAQALPPIRLDRTIRPVSVNEVSPGVFVVDAGQNLTGNAAIALAAPAGTTVTLRYGEALDAAGRLDQSDMARFITKRDPSQEVQTERYTAAGTGLEHWHSRFTYHGFRYIEITGWPGTPTADDIAIRYFHTDLPPTGEFACSNDTLNKIWQAGRWSYLSNFFGIPTDCPHREKNGWTGDAQIALEQGLFYADGFAAYEKWIHDLADEQAPTGALPGIVPSGGWGYQRYNGPAWDSAFLLIPWQLYEYYGDDSLLRDNYEGFKHYIDYLTTRAHAHLVGFGLGDWAPWKSRTPVDITDTGYYYRDALLASTLARRFGFPDDEKKYSALADAIRAAFNRQFYDAATGSYRPGSQTAQGTALYQGLVEPANDARVTAALVASIEHNDRHLDFGLLGSKYVLNALSERGRTDLAYAVASQKTQPGWGWWIEQGATTLWEHWTGTESRNHTFLGDVNAWMMKYLAGIRVDPAAPGFANIIIGPHPVGDLTSAKAHYDSVRGRIESEWTLRDGVFELRVTIPANTTATVFLPAKETARIEESDRPLADAPGVKLVTRDTAQATLALCSGRYVFRVR
jgi:alpha-L-rhamnosidase